VSVRVPVCRAGTGRRTQTGVFAYFIIQLFPLKIKK